MELAITGYSGFIGSCFLNASKDYLIRKIDLRRTKPPEISFLGVHSVIHLAAVVHQMKSVQEDVYFKVNRDLAYEVAKKAKADGVSLFVFLSSAKVYGESTTGKRAWNEFSECYPKDAYSRSKLEAEKLILGLQDRNFKVAVVRSPLVYGGGVKANMLNLVKLINKIPILPFAGINNKRSMVYVENLVALLQQIIKNENSGIFIACDSEPLSTTKLVELIAKSINKRPYLFKMPSLLLKVVKIIRPSIFERLYGSLELDNSFTNSKLMFKPPFLIEDGIQEMVNSSNTRKRNL